MTTHTVTLEDQRLDRPPRFIGRCQALMESDRRPRFGRNGVTRARRWSRPCPNAATVEVDGKRFCSAHAPAATVCDSCGRPLRAGNRTVCARCLGITD